MAYSRGFFRHQRALSIWHRCCCWWLGTGLVWPGLACYGLHWPLGWANVSTKIKKGKKTRVSKKHCPFTTTITTTYYHTWYWGYDRIVAFVCAYSYVFVQFVLLWYPRIWMYMSLYLSVSVCWPCGLRRCAAATATDTVTVIYSNGDRAPNNVINFCLFPHICFVTNNTNNNKNGCCDNDKKNTLSMNEEDILYTKTQHSC